MANYSTTTTDGHGHGQSWRCLKVFAQHRTIARGNVTSWPDDDYTDGENGKQKKTVLVLNQIRTHKQTNNSHIPRNRRNTSLFIKQSHSHTNSIALAKEIETHPHNELVLTMRRKRKKENFAGNNGSTKSLVSLFFSTVLANVLL